MNKSQLNTVRFSSTEVKLINSYLKKNVIFESFSSLARVAILNFIECDQKLKLQRVFFQEQSKNKRPFFLWDYEMTKNQVLEILSYRGYPPQKLWLIERILTQAKFNEIFEYLTIDEIKKTLPQLRLSKKILKRWMYAVQRWDQYRDKTKNA